LSVRKRSKGFSFKAEAGINRGTAPGFKAVESHLVEDWSGWQHLFGRHASSRHGLVAVAQDGVIEENWFRAHN
jgi:hypothetical protein